MGRVVSADHTVIAYERSGSGPAVILVGGGLDDGSENVPLAAALSARFTVYNYARRGRGESTDTSPYDVAREIEDIDALIAEAGGTAHLYGVSTGGALALEAAAAGSPVGRVGVYEVPYNATDADWPRLWRNYVREVNAALSDGRRGDALELFLRVTGASDGDIAGMRSAPFWPALEAQAHTLPYDAATLGDGQPPRERLATIAQPTLVITGDDRPAGAPTWITALDGAADVIADCLPRARRVTLDGQGHVADPTAVVPVLERFFADDGSGDDNGYRFGITEAAHQGDERTALLGVLQRQRDLVAWKLRDATETVLRQAQTPSGMSMPGLVRHLTNVERSWIRDVFAGQRGLRFDWTDDDPDAEWRVPPGTTMTELLADYAAEARLCDAVVAGATSLDQVSVTRNMSLRWILLHLIEETARHLGHLDLLREQADGSTGEEPTEWSYRRSGWFHAWKDRRMTTRVNADNFVRAETDRMFADLQKNVGGINRFLHNREPAAIDKQTVIRLNRDTLYSFAVVDVTDGATLTLPEHGNRYLSAMVVNQDHFVDAIFHDPGAYELTADRLGTPTVAVAVRILVDPADPDDIAAVAAIQDQIVLTANSATPFHSPAYDGTSFDETRDALLSLARNLTGFDHMFGTRKEIQPVRHLIGTAAGWGGLPTSEAAYIGVDPRLPVGQYELTVADVPVDGFWSISVYNARGFFEPNALGAYTVNNITGVPNPDGSITVRFGTYSAEVPNAIPITEGWNYLVRLYRPRPEITAGQWTFPSLAT